MREDTWQARWVNTLRLWSTKPVHEFELTAFNHGDSVGASMPTVLDQLISRLYPDVSTLQGKELRLKQEYFFTAGSIRDILAASRRITIRRRCREGWRSS